jgi:hypothetical protein
VKRFASETKDRVGRAFLTSVMAAGAHAFLYKPVDAETIASCLEFVLRD